MKSTLDYDFLLNYLYLNTLVGHTVSKANNPESEASQEQFGAKCHFFASCRETCSQL